MFCSQCGTKNADGAAFCAGCGAPMANDVAENQEAPVIEAPVAEEPKPEVPEVQPIQNDFQPNDYTPTPAPVLPGKGAGIAGMILGIASLVFMCYFYISLPCAIVGLILSISSKSKAKKAGMKNGFSVAGIITSAIGLGIAILYIVLAIIGLAVLVDSGYSVQDIINGNFDVEEFLEEYEYYYYEYSTMLRNFFK